MTGALLAAFLEADPRRKAQRTLALRQDDLAAAPGWPDRPGRPEQPILVSAREVPKRPATTVEGRAALLHALAHIELNAIDLALDIIGRFSGVAELAGHASAFGEDWLVVAQEEAKHFLMLDDRLRDLGSAYGAFRAHDSLWQAALATKDSLLDRLTLAPLTQEARGLDVTPGMIQRLRSAGDKISAGLLEIIYRDEIGHVATGHRWFTHLCTCMHLDPGTTYAQVINRVGLARPHAPFNLDGRRRAGLNQHFDEQFDRGE